MKRLLIPVMVGLAGIQGTPLAAESRPKLVVGIMVDQLRTDYLENLKEMFGNGGFRRLMSEGVYLKDIEFGEPGDAASAAAIIQTGACPRYNGITSMTLYDPVSKTVKPIFKDEGYIGNFTSETYSPAALKVSSLTDEIATEGGGVSKIHSIAPDASTAIALAGHLANSAFWINDESGRWSSTTYYSNPPSFLQNLNYNSHLISRLDTMKWVPLRKGEPYPDVTAKEIKDGFKYTFSRSDRDVFAHYKTSPYVNTDITEAAAGYLRELNYGKNPEAIDVLNIAYTLAPYAGLNGEDYKYELQDAYLRLDKNLETLLTALDKQVGKENVLVYLVSTGYFTEPAADSSDSKLPGGTFSVKRALSLINAYLSAKYGNGSYVEAYSNQQIYLDKAFIESKNLDEVKLAEEARDFLVKMSGVADAFTSNYLMNPAGSASLEAIRLSIDPKTAGDIIIEFNPGWKVIDDSVYPPVTKDNKTTVYPAPGFILGAGIAPKVVEEQVEAVSIAPTLARTLRIRAPNSSTKPRPLL